ncbi:exosortase family protein XrtF [Flavobacterium sp. 17A]|uniref:Exosortase family protein XrtF n=1 Tax=Flavobacterium potami TaxID=2872310 RepID=A0A9X1HCT2_9FLAO|nr:exosortase family protein XrtF [Flavobacterium potami]MBZ4036253.1 exosortase family protein XrtF [Flavobacterium potami]
MKKYLVQFKPFLIFVSIFFLTYIVLTMLYKLYLNGYQSEDLDGISVYVGKNVDQLMKFFNYDVIIQKSSQNAWLEIILNGKFMARLIEGCNAVSVMILFVSFVAAFSGKISKTILFIVFGIVTIYILNVIRIAALVVLLYFFPAKSKFLHDIFFPLMIYGYVFLLWVFWINRFSKYAK